MIVFSLFFENWEIRGFLGVFLGVLYILIVISAFARAYPNPNPELTKKSI
jgi:hypothetical protein